MNFIDNIISFFSPKAGAERMAYRSLLDEARGYDAGNNGRINRNWRAFNTSAENTDRYSRDLIRARARDLERNSDMLNSVVSPFTRNVVGKGRTLQALTKDDELNRQLEELWREWCKPRNCDVTATQSLTQMLRMAERRKRVDGGILFLKCYTSNGILPFQLQALEVDELDVTASQPKLNKDNKVIGGIEYNSYNKAVGYHIRKYTLDGYNEIGKSNFYEAKDIIFLFDKKRPSQVREMSDVAPVLTRVRDTNEFMTAVSVKQRIQACLSVFIKKSSPLGAAGNQPGRLNSGQSQGNKIEYEGKMLSPGMIRELNAGDEVQVVNPNGQSSDATSFIKLQQRLVGAAQGLSYEVTSRDMSQTNYSSARQGMIEDETTFYEDEELLENVMDEIYETFVISCVLAGKIQVKDFWRNKSDYFKHIWVKAAKKWIDPSKEANANKIALETNQKTFKDTCNENGVDWRRVIDDIAEVQEYAIKKGVRIGGANNDTQKTANTKPVEGTDGKK